MLDQAQIEDFKDGSKGEIAPKTEENEMTTKHKKGPWRIGAVESGRVAIDSADGQEVTGFIDPEDASLILSAPDLLEALQWYEAKAVQMGRAAIARDSKLLLELMKEVAVEYGAQARAAIAKATGEQP